MHKMDNLIKQETEINDLTPSNTNLETIFLPEVKWIKDEMYEDECPIEFPQAFFKCEYCPYKTLQTQRMEVHSKTHTSITFVNVEEIFDPESPIKQEEIIPEEEINPGEEIVPEEEIINEVNLQCVEEDLESHRGRYSFVSTLQEIFDPRKRVKRNLLVPEVKQKYGLLDKIFICKLCNYKTLQKQRYEAHVATHVGGTSYKCKECNFITPSSDSLHRHNLAHIYKCYFCTYKAASPEQLQIHKKVHTETIINIFSCSYCPFTTAYKSTLTSHQKKHFAPHGIAVKIIDTIPRNRDKITRKRDKILSNTETLPSNEKSWEKIDMPFKCEECSYRTLRKDYLDRHMIFHQKEKLLDCTECGQKFALKRSLLLHLKSHVKVEKEIYEGK